jgi:hypothetical protein
MFLDSRREDKRLCTEWWSHSRYPCKMSFTRTDNKRKYKQTQGDALLEDCPELPSA